MRTHRFGKKLKLPATIAIKHQLRTLMYLDALAKAEKAEQDLKQSADNRAKPADPVVQPSRGVEGHVRIGTEDSEFAARSHSISPAQAPGSTQ